MKSLGIVALIFAVTLKFASAETVNITGSVKTDDGDPLHLAFVQDKQFKNGVFTDSLGGFSLTVNAQSRLQVRCLGFKDTVININGQTVFAVVLKPLVNIVASRVEKKAPVADEHQDANFMSLAASMQREEPSLPNTPQTYTYTVPMKNGTSRVITDNLTSGSYDMAQGAIFPVFAHKEATEGSRYMVDNWVHGYVINSADSTIQSPLLFFNYDKIGGNLLLSKDKHAAIEVYREKIKSFTLFDALNQPITFTMVPEIDKSHFVQLICSGNNYKIYKSIKTKFVAANYTSDGVASTGNNFDSYEDENTYYVLNVKTNQLQKIALKKKAIKQAFAAEEVKINDYFKANDGDVDDNYLIAFGDFINK